MVGIAAGCDTSVKKMTSITYITPDKHYLHQAIKTTFPGLLQMLEGAFGRLCDWAVHSFLDEGGKKQTK